MPLSDTAITTIAGIGGTLAGLGAANLAESRRRKWEDRRRFHDARRPVYAAFVRSSRAIWSDLLRQTDHTVELNEVRAGVNQMKHPSNTSPGSDEIQKFEDQARKFRERLQQEENLADQLQASIGPSWNQFNDASAELLIIGSKAVRDAATKHHRLITQFRERHDAITTRKGYDRVLKPLEDAYWKSNNELMRIMRAELGTDD